HRRSSIHTRFPYTTLFRSEETSVDKTKLLGLAQLRDAVVDVDGEKVRVREVGALEFAEYGQLLKADRLKATATLIAACVIDDDGNPALRSEERRVGKEGGAGEAA